MPALILDSSVTLSLAFEDEFDDFSLRAFEVVRRDGALVPWLWPFEVANILHSGVKRSRLTASDAQRFLFLLADLPIEIARNEGQKPVAIAQELFLLFQRRNLTSYDAAYLQLAMTSGLPLASKDNELNIAAKAAGLQLFVYRL